MKKKMFSVIILLICIFAISNVNASLGLRAKPAALNSDTQINISWDSVADASYYKVYRKEYTGDDNNDDNDEGYVLLSIINVDKEKNYLYFVDTGLLPKTKYKYKVEAVKINPQDEEEIIKSETCTAETKEMQAPSIVSWNLDLNNKIINLKWINNSLATKYTAIYNEAGEEMAYLEGDGTSVSFFDPSITPGTTNKYTITSFAIVIEEQDPADDSDDDLADEPGDNSGSGLADGSGDDSGGGSGGDTGDDSGDGTGDSSGGGSGDDTGDNSGDDTGDSSGDESDDDSAGDSADINGKKASSNFEITPIKLPSITAKLDKGYVLISWEKHPQIQQFKLERAKYMDEFWGNWEVVGVELKEDTTSIKDRISDNGIYRYRLKIDTENYTGVSNISKPITNITSPSNLQCVPVSPGRIDLSWTNPPLGDFTMLVQRKDSGSSSYKTIAQVDSNITSYSDTKDIETGKTYYYRITAIDSSGNTYSTREYKISADVPDSPKYLTIDINSPTSFTLNWNDNSNNESGFIIERRTGNGSFAEIATVSANTTYYTDGTVTSSSNYTYRVTAFNPFGKARSYTSEVAASASLLTEPPVSLTVTPVSSRQIDLSWTYADYSNHSTAIERKRGKDGDWQIVDILDTGFSSYSDTNLSSDTEYFYRVKAVIDENVFSRPYPREEAENGIYTKLLTPKDLKASWQSSGIIKLEWSGILSFDSELIIERKTENSNFVPIETISPYDLKWYDTGVENNRNYTYRVKSVNSYNSSDYSNEASVEPLALPEPENFKVVVLSGSEVIIEWEYDEDKEISGFKLERRLDSDGRWREVASLGNKVRSYSIKDLDPDEVYYFRIGAYHSSMNLKSYAQPVKVLINTVKPPSDLIVTHIRDNQYLLEWKDNSENEEGFIIERRHGSKDFVEIGRVTENTQNFTDSGLEFNSIYYYRVRAYNSNVQSAHTNTVSVRTILKKSFGDLDSVPWAKTAINSLLGMGIVKGRSEEIFAPNDNITRAEFISLVVKTFELDRIPIGTFLDVRPEHWYYRDVMIAQNMGIVSGVGNNYFHPNRPIKREDMAVILARTLRITGNPLPHKDNSILEKFSDSHLISDYALSSLAVTHGAGIINGKGSGILAPKDFATRAEAVVMLYNILFKLD
ncbi:fibronectin type III domain-containing protein [Acetivibrio saccincola]|uniref:fibronectin type III domain-containing protein n=1 Tax=Acetivibrio saccincola TaxID=1677857 RepID=UPI002CFC76E2|nr:fibronectin type III domain-containing protein [Acetivibrio saccincola]HQD29500.1 fibronectin type III domain-containing protein [Acetivibrio saccincola]